jgi:hypothetical protein
MRHSSVLRLLFLPLLGASMAVATTAAQDVETRQEVAPVYVNAEVIDVDASRRTVRFGTGGGEVLVASDAQSRGTWDRLRAGDRVILAYRVQKQPNGTHTRVVTSVRSTTTTARAAVQAPGLPMDERTRLQARVLGEAAARQLARARAGYVTEREPPGPPQLKAPASITQQIPSVPRTPVPAATAPAAPPHAPPSAAETAREQAAASLDTTVAGVAARAAAVDRAWLAHRDRCGAPAAPTQSRAWLALPDGAGARPSEDACGRSFDEVSRLARQVRAQLEDAREAARRADVLPGRMRETLQRYNLDF